MMLPALIGAICSTTVASAAETSHLRIADQAGLTLKQQLGQLLFFDTNLSSPAGQACASCHDPKVGFSEMRPDLPVSKGVVEGKTGARNTPMAAYAAFAPRFHFDEDEGLWIGGQFLDGRAANLVEQAEGPPLNPDEMHNPDKKTVVAKLKAAAYRARFEGVFGKDVWDDDEMAYRKMAEAIAAFENSRGFNRFTSKFDYFLAGRVQLSEQEAKGLEVFNAEDKGNCAACHISVADGATPPLFTDYTYDNLGVPSNPEILALKGREFVDIGLG